VIVSASYCSQASPAKPKSSTPANVWVKLPVIISGVAICRGRRVRRGRGGAAEIAGVAAERKRLLRSQADRSELQLQAERGEWLRRSEVLDCWRGALLTLRNQLLGLPSRLSQTCSLDAEAAEQVDEELRRFLVELAQPQAYEAADAARAA